MRKLGIALFAAALGIGTAQAKSLKDPPLETHLHTLSENGNSRLVVIYHADHTLSMISRGAADNDFGDNVRNVTMGRGENQGKWWVQGNSFCWILEKGNNAGKTICKSNGHYIGRTPITP
jgi:hypothetical protein